MSFTQITILVIVVIVNKRLMIIFWAMGQLFCSCQPKNCSIQPIINLVTSHRHIESLPSAFSPLKESELSENFGKEMQIAEAFAKEFDLYRAITGYKRALILIPKLKRERVLQIEYSIMECYYFGMKYSDVIETFEKSHLIDANPTFPPFMQLLVILYDSYSNVGMIEKACKILQIIEKGNSEIAEKLKKYEVLKEADFSKMDWQGIHEEFLMSYKLETKSVKKAGLLNAIFPGAGYYYIGQKKSAVTAFMVNSLFTAAAYQFFSRGYTAAGAITASFEAGWYFGGINGAELEAKEYNERLYEVKAKDFMVRERFFPVLTFQTAF